MPTFDAKENEIWDQLLAGLKLIGTGAAANWATNGTLTADLIYEGPPPDAFTRLDAPRIYCNYARTDPIPEGAIASRHEYRATFSCWIVAPNIRTALKAGRDARVAVFQVEGVSAAKFGTSLTPNEQLYREVTQKAGFATVYLAVQIDFDLSHA